MSTTQAARGRKTRKTRTAATVQVSTNFINDDTHDNSVQQQQVQRVIAVSGVAPWFARIIAPMAFGGAA